MFHKDSGPVPDTFQRLAARLTKEGINFVVIGAFALAVHGYRRATEDVDLCMRPKDLIRFRERFLGHEYQLVEGKVRRFYDPVSQVTFDIIESGELAGRVSRNKVIKFPDPSETEIVEGLPTVSLARLVELKLVTWRYKDWADVVALIRANNLNEDFSDKLDPLVRMAYLECYDQKTEEDRYEREA
jgi:hypothetical protein